MIDPFVALMRRYCIDYTTVHDLDVCDEIMRSDYTVRVSGRTLAMDDYRAAVEGAFRRFPTLALSVHELFTSGERLAMRFSEHGASARHDGAVAAWQGISLYRWDGQQLVSCAVEQDFLGRERQLQTARTDPLDTIDPDPWATTVQRPANEAAERLTTAWLQAWAAGHDRTEFEEPGFFCTFDDSRLVGPNGPYLHPIEMEVNDVFSAGGRVALHASLSGPYVGGLPQVSAERIGSPAQIELTAVADVGDGGLRSLRAVSDRWGLQQRLKRA